MKLEQTSVTVEMACTTRKELYVVISLLRFSDRNAKVAKGLLSPTRRLSLDMSIGYLAVISNVSEEPNESRVVSIAESQKNWLFKLARYLNSPQNICGKL